MITNAQKLVESFYAVLPPQSGTPFDILSYAKECARVCCDELLDSCINEDGSISDIDKHSKYLVLKIQILNLK